MFLLRVVLPHPPAYLDIKPDPGYPQQYGPGRIQVPVGVGSNLQAEYELRHVSAPGPFRGAGRLSARPGTRPSPVDEIPWKKYSVHTLPAVFLQVRTLPLLKYLFCPQTSPQAVHKLCHILHRLSTAVAACWLCCGRNRGYRSGVLVLRGQNRGVPAAAWTAGLHPFSTPFVEKLWNLGISPVRRCGPPRV